MVKRIIFCYDRKMGYAVSDDDLEEIFSNVEFLR